MTFALAKKPPIICIYNQQRALGPAVWLITSGLFLSLEIAQLNNALKKKSGDAKEV